MRSEPLGEQIPWAVIGVVSMYLPAGVTGTTGRSAVARVGLPIPAQCRFRVSRLGVSDRTPAERTSSRCTVATPYTEQLRDRPDGHPGPGQGGDDLGAVLPRHRETYVAEPGVDVLVPPRVSQGEERTTLVGQRAELPRPVRMFRICTVTCSALPGDIVKAPRLASGSRPSSACRPTRNQ